MNNLQRTLSAANYGTIQRYEQAIIFRREQIENGLRKAIEKDNIKSKSRKVILLATILIAVLIAIIIILVILK